MLGCVRLVGELLSCIGLNLVYPGLSCVRLVCDMLRFYG